MKALLRKIYDGKFSYDALMFVCPGCVAGGPKDYDGIHVLAVNSEVKHPSWDWNGDLEAPTLQPSIKSEGYSVCHSFLRDGVFRFLSDSTHSLAGQSVPMPDLPDWVSELSEDDPEDAEGTDDG